MASEQQKVDLDFGGVNAILNALMNPRGADPVSPTEGQVWYRTDTEKLRLRLSASTVDMASGGGITAVIEDTAPQLGGMLDVNAQALGDGTLALLTFVEDGSAVNNLEIENQATGGGPILRATGSDTNVDMEFVTKGSGAFNFTGNITLTGTVDGRDVGADGTDLDDAVTLTGVAANSTDLGTFTGATIADTQTIKAALQALETALEAITGATNLSVSTTTTTVVVESDTGTNATIPTATTSDAGVMSTTLWDKLDAIEASADVTPIIDDDTMATATSSNVPSAESVVAYIATEITGVTRYKGGYNASTNTPDLDSSPITTEVGDQYTVTAAGTFFSTAVEVGDLLIAEIDSASVEADWTIVNRNIDAASETVAGIAEIATQTEVNTGSDTTRYVTPATLATKPFGYAVDCDAAATTTVTHNLGTLDVHITVVEVSTGETVRTGEDRTGINAVDITINPTPSAGDFRILVSPIV